MLQYCCVLSSGYLSRFIYFKKSPDIKIYLTILSPEVHAISQMILLHFFSFSLLIFYGKDDGGEFFIAWDQKMLRTSEASQESLPPVC